MIYNNYQQTHSFLYIYVVILHQKQGELPHVSIPDIKTGLYIQNIYRNSRRI